MLIVIIIIIIGSSLIKMIPWWWWWRWQWFLRITINANPMILLPNTTTTTTNTNYDSKLVARTESTDRPPSNSSLTTLEQFQFLFFLFISSVFSQHKINFQNRKIWHLPCFFFILFSAIVNPNTQNLSKKNKLFKQCLFNNFILVSFEALIFNEFCFHCVFFT